MMVALAQRVSAALSPPLTVYFRGDLGAGKTTFVRALVQALGHPGRVKSPTYGLLEHYALPGLDVLHLDLYRIGDPAELEFLGIGDLVSERTLLLVEWPERGEGYLPDPDLVIRLRQAGPGHEGKRDVTLFPHSRSGNTLCEFIDSLL
jgi:tRNA threonylcarbamoyladenosine biosynthesis protein TsaE